MKIKPEHIQLIKKAISKSKNLLNFSKEYKEKGQSAMRFRWDTLYTSMNSAESKAFFDAVYTYANDDHIDTVLRNVICDDEWNLKFNNK